MGDKKNNDVIYIAVLAVSVVILICLWIALWSNPLALVISMLAVTVISMFILDILTEQSDGQEK